jgi:hypothetical protein
MRLVPIVQTLDHLLDRMDAALGPFVSAGLPVGAEWQTDMLLLDCLHASPGLIGGIKDFVVYCSNGKASGFTCTGMDADTADLVRSGLAKIAPALASLVVIHPLVGDRFCLFGRTESDLRAVGKALGETAGCDPIEVENAVDFAISLNGYGERHADSQTELTARMDTRAHLAAYRDWWSQQQPYAITAAGIVIGYANYCRVNPQEKLPALATLI